VAQSPAGWQTRVRALCLFGRLDFGVALSSVALWGISRPLPFAGAPLPVMMPSLPLAMIPALGVQLIFDRVPD
jgi:hypothetical protein